MTFHSPIFIRKHTRIIAMAVFLYQIASGMLSLLPLDKTATGGGTLSGMAWASEPTPEIPTTTPTSTVEQPPVDLKQESTEQSFPTTTGVEPVKPEIPPAETFIDLLHSEISRRLLSSATWLDSYFGDERYLLEQNKSYLRVRYDVFQEEKAKPLFRPAFDLRVVLPQLEKMTHLVFSAEPKTTPADTGTPVTPTGERITPTDERSLTTALHYFIRSEPRESFLIRTGFAVTQGKPALFIAPRYRSLNQLGSWWDFRFTQDVIYRTNTQWQTDTILDFERILSQHFFFRTSLEGIWYANLDGYLYYISFILRHAFDATHAVEYEWVNAYQTRPDNELTEVDLRVRYRHSFWRQWLFFEVAPQVRFPRTGNFDIIPGILFRLETFFGRLTP